MIVLKKIIAFFKELFNKKKNVYLMNKRELSLFEKELLELINNYRKSKSLSNLVENSLINDICYRNNLRMINEKTINHNGATDRFDEVKSICEANYVSEILAYNYSTVNHVISGWLNSKSHLKQIEYSDLTDFGVSMIEINNKKFYTLIFANKK